MKDLTLVFKKQKGATSIEYALIGALIFLVIVASVTLVSNQAGALYDHIADAVGAALGGG